MNESFVNLLGKLSLAQQDKVLAFLASAQEKGWTVLAKSEKFIGWVQKTAGAIGKGKWANLATKIAKSKVGKVISSPWVTVGVDVGLNSVNNYYDKNSGAHKNVGKAIVGGTIDAVTNIGPIDGALIGAQFGGAPGAVAGLFIGSVIYITKKAWPNWPKKAKEGAYKIWDKITEAPEKIGKSVNSGIDSIKKTASTGIKNYSNRVKDNAKKLANNVATVGTQSSLQFDWFG